MYFARCAVILALMAFSDVVQAGTGFIVLAPDRGFVGNNQTREAFESFAADFEARLVFVTDERGEPYFRRAVQQLAAAGHERAVLVHQHPGLRHVEPGGSELGHRQLLLREPRDRVRGRIERVAPERAVVERPLPPALADPVRRGVAFTCLGVLVAGPAHGEGNHEEHHARHGRSDRHREPVEPRSRRRIGEAQVVRAALR